MVEEVKEAQKNCKSCNKPLKKVRRYYKDGIYYCSRKCYKSFKAKQKEEAKEKEAAAPQPQPAEDKQEEKK
ncbi:MAG: hypothetical protein PHR44_05435 [Candidatus Omnitrophica bacterium]|nr:hypothetical protein [Candidatus Omnitrophota bacterium]